MSEQPSLFLSYASADQEFATRLAMDLQAGGAKVWIDQEEMKLGDPVVIVVAVLHASREPAEWQRRRG